MTEGAEQASSDKTAIRPFKIGFPETELTELRRRVSATRWPERETVTDDSQGVRLAMMQDLARYGRPGTTGARGGGAERSAELRDRDRRARHPLHPRPLAARGALPLIVTHGWPGSIIEQLKIIEPLTNPTAHGANAADAFHLVIPSLPGHGFSASRPAPGGIRPHRTGLGGADEAPRVHPVRGAGRGLGRGRHAGDGRAGGAGVARHSLQHAWYRPGRDQQGGRARRPAAIGSVGEETPRVRAAAELLCGAVAYSQIMSTRPQTLYGLADSPVDLAAFMLDHGDGTGQPGLVEQVLQGTWTAP